MAVEKRKYTNRTTYRAYWRNPWTGKIEKGPSRDTLKEARKDDAEIKLKLEYEPDYFLPDNQPNAEDGLTFFQLSQMYLARTDLAESTRESEFHHLKSVNAAIGGISAKFVTRESVKNFEFKQLEQGFRQNTVHRRIGLVRSILNWAEDRGLIGANPVHNFRSKRGEDRKNPPPSPQEVALLIEYAIVPHLKRAIILAYYLGVRVGESELLQLKWEDFDTVRRRIRVWSAQKNKSMPWRDLDLVDSLFALMSDWQRDDAGSGVTHLIHIKGKPIKSISTAWRTLLRKLKDAKKIPESRHIRPYDLRHAYGTETIAAGADPRTVADNMGHADTSMLHRHYQHPLNEQKRKVQESVPDILSGVQDRGTKQSLSGHFLYPDKILFQ